MMATSREPGPEAPAASARSVAGPQFPSPWQELIDFSMRRGRGGGDQDLQGSFTSERNLGALDAENARIAAGCAERGKNRAAREETQFHQSVGEVVRQVQANQSGVLPRPQFSQTPESRLVGNLFETELHLPSVCYGGKAVSMRAGSSAGAC